VQGEQEEHLGMPISPMCNKATVCMPRAQLNFIGIFLKVSPAPHAMGGSPYPHSAASTSRGTGTIGQDDGRGQSAGRTCFLSGRCAGQSAISRRMNPDRRGSKNQAIPRPALHMLADVTACLRFRFCARFFVNEPTMYILSAHMGAIILQTWQLGSIPRVMYIERMTHSRPRQQPAVTCMLLTLFSARYNPVWLQVCSTKWPPASSAVSAHRPPVAAST
jgi:hypothetical protein